MLRSHVDHIYDRPPPPQLGELCVMSHSVGGLLKVHNASDHIPVIVRIFARGRRHPLLRHPLGGALPHPLVFTRGRASSASCSSSDGRLRPRRRHDGGVPLRSGACGGQTRRAAHVTGFGQGSRVVSCLRGVARARGLSAGHRRRTHERRDSSVRNPRAGGRGGSTSRHIGSAGGAAEAPLPLGSGVCVPPLSAATSPSEALA